PVYVGLPRSHGGRTRLPRSGVCRTKRSSGSKRITGSWFHWGLLLGSATQQRRTNGKVEAARKIVVTCRACRPFGGDTSRCRHGALPPALEWPPWPREPIPTIWAALNRSFCWAGRPRQRLPICCHGLDGDPAVAYIPGRHSPQ